MRFAVVFLLFTNFSATPCFTQEQPDSFRSSESTVAQGQEAEISKLRKRALSGEAEAQFSLAQILSNGLTVATNNAELKELEEAVKEIAKLYTLAANQGHAESQGYLGMLYLDGTGVSKDTDIAERLLTSSADGGSVFGMHNLATIHMTGLAKSPNREKAKTLFENAAKTGDSESMYSLGLMSNQVEDFEAAFHWYTKAAEKGHAEAENNLGIYFLTGNSFVKRDEALAFKWFESSARHGFALAQCSLGDMFMQGSGCQKDQSKANDWYKLAANQGDGVASFKLGMNRALGLGSKESELAAFMLFIEAKKKGVDLRVERDNIMRGISSGDYDQFTKKAVHVIESADPGIPPYSR